MVKSEELISSYAAAGFEKIHLDTSMPCADDIAPLTDKEKARHLPALLKDQHDLAYEVHLADYRPGDTYK